MNMIKNLIADKKVLTYLLLQYITIFIFLSGNLARLTGLNLRLYAVIFGVCSLVATYYILTNFKHLWSTWAFRFLFLFCVFNLFYSFFYSSDFRSSNYIDIWIHGNVGLQKTLLESGYEVATREFGSGETRFIKYLTGIIPLFSFVVGYMTFFGAKTLEEAGKKLKSIIDFLTAGYFAYFLALVVCIAIGSTTMVWMSNRLRIDDGFTGSDFDGLMLLLFIGFSFALSKIAANSRIKNILNINIVILALLIILGIKKGTIISVLIGLAVIFTAAFFFREKRAIQPANSAGTLVLIVLSPLLLVAPFYILLECQDLLENLVYNITNRFSDNDTLDVRATNWMYYVRHWMDNLNLFTAIFGFGTDSSRETSFFLSSMQPEEGYTQPHIHNIYLEYFYNWGLVALFYFLPLLLIVYKNVQNVLKKTANSMLKLFSAVSTACILFYLVFYTAESPAVPGTIVFFALIGFLESAKYAFAQPFESSLQKSAA